jgi:integrase
MSVRFPKYRLHKGSGQALVQVNGHRIYLGKHGSEESKEKYRRIVAEWLANGNLPPSPTMAGTTPGVTGGVLVDQVILAYWQFAQGYYQKNGHQTGEAYNIRTALRPLRRLYGSTPASAFGPDALEVVQRSMIDGGLSRNVINGRVSRIKRMFRWASKKKMVPGETYYGLKSVDGLQRGRFNVRETTPVKPVPDEHVLVVLPKLNVVVRAMVQVQELAGMRPQDIRNMRTCDLDMTGDVWVYRPWTHKTEHRGHVRRIAIGPRAQAILRPFLKPDNPTAYMFSPKEAVAAIRAEKRRLRKTPLTPSQRAQKPKSKPKRVPGEQYTRSSYEYAIGRACKKAEVPRWGPNRLRHNCATKVRKKFGIEATAAVLGHSLGVISEVYAEAVFEKAIEVMREIG